MSTHKNILVIDLEATCWDDKTKQGQQVNEIIEIGYALLNLQTLRIEVNDTIMVKPTTSKVSEFCTALTTIKPEDVELAMSFEQSLQELGKVMRTHGVENWASYGDYDRSMFDRQCKREKIENLMPRKHINVSHQVQIINSGNGVGMAGALRLFGISLKGTHHRGMDDAYNIAALLAKMTGMVRFELKQIARV